MFLEPTYIPRELNTETWLRQGGLFYSAGLHRNHELVTANTGKMGRGFGKNAGKWTGRVELAQLAYLIKTIILQAIWPQPSRNSPFSIK